MVDDNTKIVVVFGRSNGVTVLLLQYADVYSSISAPRDRYKLFCGHKLRHKRTTRTTGYIAMQYSQAE